MSKGTSKSRTRRPVRTAPPPANPAAVENDLAKKAADIVFAALRPEMDSLHSAMKEITHKVLPRLTPPAEAPLRLPDNAVPAKEIAVGRATRDDGRRGFVFRVLTHDGKTFDFALPDSKTAELVLAVGQVLATGR